MQHVTKSADGVMITSVESIKSGEVCLPNNAKVIVIETDESDQYLRLRNNSVLEPLGALVRVVSRAPNYAEVLKTTLDSALKAIGHKEHVGDVIQRRFANPKWVMKHPTLFSRRGSISDGAYNVILGKDVPVDAIRHDQISGRINFSQDNFKNAVIKSANWLSSSDVSKQAGFTGKNPSSGPNKWKRSGKVFCIQIGGKDYFPSYIFDVDGKPFPVIQNILEKLGKKSQWAIAAWFSSDNGWLGGKAPKDVFKKDPESVIKAATMEGRPSEHG